MTIKKNTKKKIKNRSYKKYGKIIIGNEEFKTESVSKSIQFKLNKTFKRNVNIVELPESIRLIDLCIGRYARKYLRLRTRFYVCDVITKKANSLKRYIIKDIGKSVGEIFKVLEDNNIKVHLHGGVIRDFFTRTRSTDIDIVFDTDVYKLEKICSDQKWPCKQIIHHHQYINFGEDKGISLEGSNLKGTYLEPMYKYGFTANNFTYDYKNGILIDIAGQGLIDVLNRKIRITPYPNQYNKWVRDYKKPLRYFKMIQKGFVPLHPNLHNYICNYIENNFENVYNKPVTTSVEYSVIKIKHFLVNVITNGECNNDGTFKLGVNKHKLVPYLVQLQKYLNQLTMDKILKILEDDKVINIETKEKIIRFKKQPILNAMKISERKLTKKYKK